MNTIFYSLKSNGTTCATEKPALPPKQHIKAKSRLFLVGLVTDHR